MEIAKCTPKDAPRLQALAEEAYRQTFGPYNTEENMDQYIRDNLSLQRLEKELACSDSAFVFALDEDGRPAGYLKLNHAPVQTELKDPASLEIERIYALQQYQGKGVGPLLMQYAIRQAVQEQKAYLWLGVWEKNPRAIRFYEKHGFYRFGQHVFQLGEDRQLDYLMRKDF